MAPDFHSFDSYSLLFNPIARVGGKDISSVYYLAILIRIKTVFNGLFSKLYKNVMYLYNGGNLFLVPQLESGNQLSNEIL